MKFFIDSANLAEIDKANQYGIIDGVTTNPSLVAKEGKVDFKEHIHKICSMVDGPVSAEVVSTDYEGIMREGLELAEIHPNVTVKVPMLPDGLRAVRQLSRKRIKTNVTLIFSAPQAILAAKAGATFVSPFIGRLDDIAHDGMAMISDLVEIFYNYDFETEILVASVRHPVHIVDAAKLGAHVATIPFKVIEQLTKHPLTDIGLEKFLADWHKSQGQ
ncbi:MAG: fructose-6-phosphate aldolase [Blastocatellia bacterium]|nr:fructose-6-phosphate aldolase [Blastocatellia bacterium]